MVNNFICNKNDQVFKALKSAIIKICIIEALKSASLEYPLIKCPHLNLRVK